MPVETGIIKVSENPALDPKAGGVRTPSVKHYAAIAQPEALGQLIRAIRSYKGTPIVRAALQFTPLVFQRPGQVRAAEWDQFDLERGLWICLAAMMKGRLERKQNGPPHLVPLPREAVAILKDLYPLTGPKGFVFSSRKAGVPISDGTCSTLTWLGIRDARKASASSRVLGEHQDFYIFRNAMKYDLRDRFRILDEKYVRAVARTFVDHIANRTPVETNYCA